MAREGVEHIFHYLDDFAVVGLPDSNTCQKYLDFVAKTCRYLCVPFAPEKQEGPNTATTFLGIEIDMIQQVLRLPREKLDRLGELIRA